MDLAAMKAKLAQLNAKSGNPLLYKPTDGKSVIRIVPLASNPASPFQEFQFHYLNNKTYLSPLTYGEPDPIAEFSDALVSEGNLSKEDWKAAKKFYPQTRTYVPVVVRGKESEGVKYWGFGAGTLKALLGFINDPEYGDLSDVKEGTDLNITFTPQEKSDTNFSKTEIFPARKASPLSTDAELVKKLTTEQESLSDTFKKWTYDELKAVLDAYVTGQDAPATQSSSAPVEEVAAPQKTEEEVSAAVSATDEFDEVFNK